MRCAVAISLITLMLISIMPLRMDMHSCNGRLVGWSLTGKAEDCGHDPKEAAPSCAEHADASYLHKKDCCADRTLLFEGETPITTIKKNGTSPLEFQVPLMVILPTLAFSDPGQRCWNIHTKWWPPPLEGRDILVREKTLLI